MEFGSVKSEEGDEGRPKSLEMLLLEKNRTLQTDNTQLKVANADLTGKGFLLIQGSIYIPICYELCQNPLAQLAVLLAQGK